MIEISKSVKMIATGNSFIDGTLEGMNGTPLEKSIANRFTAFIKASRPSLETLEKIAVSSRKKGDTVLNEDDAKKVALFIHKLQAIKDMPFEFSIRTLKNFISSIESYVEDMDLLDAYDMAHDDIKNSFGDDANVAVYEGVKDTLYGSSWISRFSNK
jgi:MoxR-like ATPase